MVRTYRHIGLIGLHTVYVCSDCSAVVKSKEQHQDWHQRLVDILKTIVVAT